MAAFGAASVHPPGAGGAQAGARKLEDPVHPAILVEVERAVGCVSQRERQRGAPVEGVAAQRGPLGGRGVGSGRRGAGERGSDEGEQSKHAAG